MRMELSRLESGGRPPRSLPIRAAAPPPPWKPETVKRNAPEDFQRRKVNLGSALL